MKPSLRNRQHRLVVVVACLGLSVLQVGPRSWAEEPKPPPDQGGEKEKAAKEPDAAAIAKLVEKLGSKDFTERQEATKALEAIGFPALDALRKAAKGNDVEVAQRAARLVTAIENGFDSLLADYRGYELPLPPKDAKLVRFKIPVWTNDKQQSILGFLLQPGTKDNQPLVLVGTQEARLEPDAKYEVVEPKPDAAKDISHCWMWQSTYDMNAGLAIALQCKARGWNTLAEHLWTASLKRDVDHHFGAFYQPANLPNRTAVAYLAWAYSGNELVKPDSDRTKTAKRMKAVLAAEPRLNIEGNRALLESLEAALVPSTAKPGSVERMIDDLTDVCNLGRRHDESDPRYTRLAQMGFAAVPALIEHLNDNRLTRSFVPGLNNFPPQIRPVKHVVTDLLKDLAGAESRKDWEWQQDGWTVAQEDAQAWWEKARKVGEETYFLSHVLPGDEDSPNSLMLDIIAKKYSKHLPKLYKTILDERPEMQSWPLAEALAKSSLPDETKRELFLHASNNKNLEHRRTGLSHLQKLDPKEFMKILLATLEALPKTPTAPLRVNGGYWKCPEGAYAHLVLATDDPKAWETLEKVAKRSEVDLRIQFMNPMNDNDIGDRHLQQRLKFLAAFLDDAEALDARAFEHLGVCLHAGFKFTRLQVRDLAAMQIASILKMPDEPDKNWTPEQWDKLRKKVKEAIKR